MFCSRCGNEIKGDGKFCPKCGAPVKPIQNQGPEMSGANTQRGNAQTYSYSQNNYSQGAVPAGGAAGTGAPAAKKRPPYVAIGAIVLAVILLIVAVRLIFFRDTYKTPIKNMVKVMEDRDVDAAMNLIPENFLDAAESLTGMDKEEMADMLEDDLVEAFDQYIGEIEIDYEIGDTRDLTQSELNDISDEYMGVLGSIEEGKEVEFSYEMYVDGELEEESGDDETINVVKIDGKWYISPDDLF